MTVEAPAMELAAVQLDRYAEDFGALFSEYQDLRTQFDHALRGGPRAGEIQRSLEELLRGMADVGVVLTDCDGVIREASPAASILLGCGLKEIAGQPLAAFASEEDRKIIGDVVLGLDGTAVEVSLKHRDGSPLVGRVLRVPDPEHGYAIHWLLRLADDTSLDAANRANLFCQLHVKSANAIMVTDERGTVLSINPAFREITGYGEDDILGKTPALLSSGRHDPAFYDGMWQALKDHGEWQGEIWNRRKSGEIYLEWLHIVAGGDAAGGPL